MSIEKNIQLSSGLDRTPKLTEKEEVIGFIPTHYTIFPLLSLGRAVLAMNSLGRGAFFFFFWRLWVIFKKDIRRLKCGNMYLVHGEGL